MTDTNDKPFVCSDKDCLMRFSTIDHLMVHQKRHEMKLKFPTISSTSFTIADQTPTPSRILGNFLQNWEAVGLNSEMQEITNLTPILNDTNQSKTAEDSNTCNSKSSSVSNPFAQSFQNALKNPITKLKIPDILTTTTTSDSPLNTPSIFPNEGLMAIVNAALNTPYHDFPLDTTGANTANIDKVDAINNTSNESLQPMTTLVTRVVTTASNGHSTTETLSQKSIAIKGQRFQAVPVIRTANTNISLNNNISITQTVPNIVISKPNHQIIKTINTINTTKLRTVPIAQQTVQKTTAIIAPKIKADNAITIANNNSLYKVILKLPDGRSVQLPLIQTPINQTSLQPTTVTNITPKENALTTVTNSESLAITSSSSLSSSVQSKVDASLASLPPKAKPGRKSKFAPEEDPKEKKARSLERNRAAAMRCRLKRKHWIDSLEEKADEYERHNEKLNNEVVSLRREVTLLKTALLAHKDCPVTQQQQQKTVSSNEIITISTTNGNLHKIVNNNLESNGLT
ncbi:cyclic AMP-dependent transcription factor ATF-7-like [Oppia nitens]|uniref:cyclic AMP-dependent transcription factor ATF-7-like n=1 Tax=Oppia nitens TaxID=1686743 RepID=UPI0023D9A9FB|nr:cyclic AMP-dependent transcription factor ATF-7-like [Oppia nitens]